MIVVAFLAYALVLVFVVLVAVVELVELVVLVILTHDFADCWCCRDDGHDRYVTHYSFSTESGGCGGGGGGDDDDDAGWDYDRPQPPSET